MGRATRQLLTISAVMLLLLLGLLAGGAGRLRAQDATPGVAARPIHIHAGTCPDVGEVVQPLADLTAPTGTSAGQASAIPGEYSYMLVPMSLDSILAADHAINAHESAANIGNYIACGDLGGVVDANGSLVVGLQERNDSGFSGVAVLTVNASDPNATDVSVFIAQDLSEAGP